MPDGRVRVPPTNHERRENPGRGGLLAFWVQLPAMSPHEPLRSLRMRSLRPSTNPTNEPRQELPPSFPTPKHRGVEGGGDVCVLRGEVQGPGGSGREEEVGREEEGGVGADEEVQGMQECFLYRL